MPFQPGRAKTGGRQKGGSTRKSNKLLEQLKFAGFNYVAELAATLKGLRDLRTNATDQKADPNAYAKAVELKFFYNELKSLLPYMAPKLREKEVELVEASNDITQLNPSAISDDDLMKALEHGSEKQSKPRASRPDPVAARRVELPATSSSEIYLQDVVAEQEDN